MGVEDESPSIAAAAFCCAPASEMQKAEDAADMSVLFFSAGANFLESNTCNNAGTGASSITGVIRWHK